MSRVPASTYLSKILWEHDPARAQEKLKSVALDVHRHRTMSIIRSGALLKLRNVNSGCLVMSNFSPSPQRA